MQCSGLQTIVVQTSGLVWVIYSKIVQAERAETVTRKSWVTVGTVLHCSVLQTIFVQTSGVQELPLSLQYMHIQARGNRSQY